MCDDSNPMAAVLSDNTVDVQYDKILCTCVVVFCDEGKILHCAVDIHDVHFSVI